MKRHRICIVGSGSSGLACARVFSSDDYNCEPTVFEQNPFIGGQWHYDPDGLSETTAVYKNLKTNIPCGVMQFSDFPFQNSDPEAYVGCKDVQDYIIAYAEKHQLYQYILLNTKVNSIDETFTVTYTVPIDKENEMSKRSHQKLVMRNENYATYSEQFDAICVANGHYTEMYIPNDIPGLHSQTFPIMHSHSYREPEHYRDKCVIVVGASHSGVDISSELAPIAKQVILSMKEENKNQYEAVLNMLRQNGKELCTNYLSTTFSIVPPIERIDKDTVYFQNQTSIKPDLIIFATGYEYRMPFLQGKLQVDQDRLCNSHYVYPLYKQLFHADFPDGTLSFLAIPYRIVPFPLAEVQSHIIARVLCGKLSLPTRDDMINAIDNLSLPLNRSYHLVNMIEYAENLFEMMRDNKRIYDVTKWNKHPGGQTILNHYAGQDSTESVRAFHPNIAFVQKYFKTFYIGDLIGDDNKKTTKYDDQALKDDFEQLRQKRYCKSTSWLPYLITILFYIIAGRGSADWWNNMHFQHHSKPNSIDKDPDTRVEPLFLLGNVIPIRKAKVNAKYGKTVVVSQSNHVVTEVSYDDSELSWFQLQLKGTCNIIKSPLNDWFTGHLNFQIEHQQAEN
ncbi:unnamed protein product [Rotaria magnacalcarata]|uniref:Flavin-containing monooxygenase n=3 Tax=Rotaria magnacalcarata TaxID=392030 RepID=A0A816DLI2_9BILA|nr:unnamed protein product [Rotaria magnacalcarata]